jgi:hypothetical protein
MAAMRTLRILLAALALSAAVPGAWAAAAPHGFFAGFPGAGHHWVDRAGAYDEHLVLDAGAFYLGFALLLAWAALRPARELAVPACAAFGLFSAIHLAFHVAHLGGFPTADAVAQTASLVLVLAGCGLAIWMSARAASGRPRSASGGA